MQDLPRVLPAKAHRARFLPALFALMLLLLPSLAAGQTIAVGEYGDAPDGTNAGYTAPLDTVTGNFPTRFNTTNSRYSLPGGHTLTKDTYIGQVVSLEQGARDVLDPDLVENLVDDDFDDGLVGSLCPLTTSTANPFDVELTFDITLDAAATAGTRYVNVLIDADQDGVWNDQPTSEWVVQDYPVTGLVPGTTTTVTVGPFPLGASLAGMWMRVAVTDERVVDVVPVDITGWDGSGAFDEGEIEDYLVRNALFLVEQAAKSQASAEADARQVDKVYVDVYVEADALSIAYADAFASATAFAEALAVAEAYASASASASANASASATAAAEACAEAQAKADAVAAACASCDCATACASASVSAEAAVAACAAASTSASASASAAADVYASAQAMAAAYALAYAHADARAISFTLAYSYVSIDLQALLVAKAEAWAKADAAATAVNDVRLALCGGDADAAVAAAAVAQAQAEATARAVADISGTITITWEWIAVAWIYLETNTETLAAWATIESASAYASASASSAESAAASAASSASSSALSLAEAEAEATASCSGSCRAEVCAMAEASASALVISEVLTDAYGFDQGYEWVEIYNPGASPIDLSGWSLGNGLTDYTASLVQLSGVIQPGQTFVVGGPNSDGANGFPMIDMPMDFAPDFQNGTGGVALFNMTADVVATDTVPIDALVYGDDNPFGLIDETGLANPPDTMSAPEGMSLERLDFTSDSWQPQPQPTAGDSPLVELSNPC